MKTVQILTESEAERFLTGLNFIRNRLAALLMLDSGLRVGEVVGLHRTSLFVNGEPNHRVQISSEITKNHQSRFVPLTSRLQDTIRNAATFFWNMQDQDPNCLAIYSYYHTKPLSTRQLERIFSAIGHETIGRTVWPHMLRHTFASRLMKVTSMRVVQELLGHQRISSTQIYTHPDSSDLTQAMKAIEK